MGIGLSGIGGEVGSRILEETLIVNGSRLGIIGICCTRVHGSSLHTIGLHTIVLPLRMQRPCSATLLLFALVAVSQA